MNLAVVTSGFLPIPATKGGAVENLVVNLINENEKKHNLDFTIFSIYDEKAIEESKKYKYAKFIFLKVNSLAKILDKVVFPVPLGPKNIYACVKELYLTEFNKVFTIVF